MTTDTLEDASGGEGTARIRELDGATMRRLLLHEAEVHAVPGRELRDLGDAILVTDPAEPDPFVNRLEGLRWPSEPDAFDRRLTEALVLFASLGRQPHIWATPVGDEPADLVARLEANGFQDMGKGDVMVLADPRPAIAAAAEPPPPGVTVERLSGLAGDRATAAVHDVVDVLLDAFEMGEALRATLEFETAASVADSRFTHYVARVEGRPAAVAKRGTFDGASYLSSIGTAAWAQRRGLGSLVTRLAAADATAAGSDWTYLGVFAGNVGAASVYRKAGFVRVGRSCPDMILA
jgi:ribosomal protein S18 acetylase RimI-like enzyme